VGLLNVNGYYDPLLQMLDRAEAEKFIFPEHRRSLLCDSDPSRLLDLMREHQHPHEAVKRWMRQG
jgi:predicted Rossmann-fold nucleotide-binding protein